MAKFNVGDRVRVGPKGLNGVRRAAGMSGIVKSASHGLYEVLFIKDIVHDDDIWTRSVWYGNVNNLSLAADGGTEMRSPTIVPSKRSMQRASYRLNQAILKHLESGKSISPMEALVVHGCLRLAAAICDLRQVGHNIKTDIHRDSNGKQYARYSLTNSARVAA